MNKDTYHKEVRPNEKWYKLQKLERPTPVVEPVKPAPPKKVLTWKEKLARRKSTRATRRKNNV